MTGGQRKGSVFRERWREGRHSTNPPNPPNPFFHLSPPGAAGITHPTTTMPQANPPTTATSPSFGEDLGRVLFVLEVEAPNSDGVLRLPVREQDNFDRLCLEFCLAHGLSAAAAGILYQQIQIQRHHHHQQPPPATPAQQEQRQPSPTPPPKAPMVGDNRPAEKDEGVGEPETAEASVSGSSSAEESTDPVVHRVSLHRKRRPFRERRSKGRKPPREMEKTEGQPEDPTADSGQQQPRRKNRQRNRKRQLKEEKKEGAEGENTASADSAEVAENPEEQPKQQEKRRNRRRRFPKKPAAEGAGEKKDSSEPPAAEEKESPEAQDGEQAKQQQNGKPKRRNPRNHGPKKSEQNPAGGEAAEEKSNDPAQSGTADEAKEATEASQKKKKPNRQRRFQNRKNKRNNAEGNAENPEGSHSKDEKASPPPVTAESKPDVSVAEQAAE